jgi:hypothetical protein
MRREIESACLSTVIASAAKQSISTAKKKEWIASLRPQ